MKISVCMASYNGEKYIEEQLTSILPQLEEEDELIISDDSSTDSTLRVIEESAHDRAMVLSGNTYHSPIFNLENALNRATGDVVVLSDQDDVWMENRLPLVRRHLSQPGPSVRMLVTDGFIIDENGAGSGTSLFTGLRPGPLRMKAGKGLFRNLYDNTYMGCCMAFTRELLHVALPFPARIPMHDSWLGMLAEIFGSVQFLPEKTILYRRHPQNLSFRRFTVAQQIQGRFFLACHLLERRFSPSFSNSTARRRP